MNPEYQALAVLALFFILAWVPASIAKLNTFGWKWLASNRSPVEGKTLDSWGARCERAHNNLKEFFPGFIVAVLILGAADKFDQGTAYASIIYVIARICHFISYGIGNVLGRGLFFFIGLFANIYLLIKILI
jgi:uncharacterized MAPEG superfamily protein